MPFIQGGTGIRSEELSHPDFLPDSLESGTKNVPGLCGLRAGVEFIRKEGLVAIRNHEKTLTKLLLDGISGIERIRIHGIRDAEKQTAVVSVTVNDTVPGEVGRLLDRDFGIATRASLHCAALAHRTLGTFSRGTVRLSLGYFNTRKDVLAAIRALEEISGG